MKRISFAITAKIEAKILDYLVTKLPSWATPDLLTLAALFSAAVGGASYTLAQRNPNFLLIVNLCLILHWLTDSLDGRVARYRKQSRPNYGFYVDHVLDSLSAALFLGGLTTSPLTQTAAWIWVLALMLLSMIHMFLKAKVFNVFEMSIQLAGPTEARLGLMGFNFLILFFGNPIFMLLSVPVALIDIIGWITVVGFIAVLAPDILRAAAKLDKIDKKKKFIKSSRAKLLIML